MIEVIASAETPRWSPTIVVSQMVDPSSAIDVLGYRAPARIRAPAIHFSKPQPLLVTGGRFTVVSRLDGLVDQSTYLAPDPIWPVLIDDGARRLAAPDRPLLVSANAGWRNYAHWLYQCFAPAVTAHRHGYAECAILSPPLNALHREAFALADIASDRIFELDVGEITLPTRGIYTNLTGGDFFLAPHPALLDAMARIGQAVPEFGCGPRIYLARLDATQRRMENEAELCAKLEERGFRIVTLSGRSLAQQIAIVRSAALIVAPHGAGLTNLVFAEGGSGLTVIELMQENYVNPVFLKIAQAKGLDYSVLINPLRARGDGRHGSSWAADIPALMAMLDRL